MYVICVNVYVHVYMHIDIHTHILYIYMYTHIIYIYIHVYVCYMCKCICTYIHVFVYTKVEGCVRERDAPSVLEMGWMQIWFPTARKAPGRWQQVECLDALVGKHDAMDSYECLRLRSG